MSEPSRDRRIYDALTVVAVTTHRGLLLILFGSLVRHVVSGEIHYETVSD